MKQIDLEDLPPRLAAKLAGLAPGEAVILAQGGVTVGTLTAAPAPAPVLEPPSEREMTEVLEHFNAMIHDDFL